MNHPPRPPKEPIVNKFMQLGIVIQTIAITAATLGAFAVGLYADSGHLELAETMAFVTLSMSELLRAFTARSEYYPLLKIGAFKNKLMNWAVLASFILILLVIYVPFLQPIFNTKTLTWWEWLVMTPLILLPSIAAELMKTITSKRREKQALKVND